MQRQHRRVDQQGDGFGQVGVLDQPGREIDEVQIEADAERQHHAGYAQDGAPLGLEGGHHRRFAGLADRHDGRVRRQGAADQQHHQSDEQAEQEGRAPSPGGACRRGQQAGDGGAHDRAQQHAGRGAGGREAADDPASGALGGLHQQHHGGGELSAHRHPLAEAQRDQHDRGEDADIGVGRHQADQQGRDGHEQHRSGQGVLAPMPVAHVSEDQRPQRPAEEAHGEHAERRHQGCGRVVGGEELLAHDGGEIAVDAEVVPLHHIASETRDHRTPLRPADLQVHQFGGVGDLRPDQVHPPQLANARSGLVERAVVQDAMEYAAGVREGDQGDVLWIGEVTVEQQREDAPLALEPLLAPLHGIAAGLQHPEEGVVLLAQHPALAQPLNGFRAKLQRLGHEPANPLARMQPPGLCGDLGEHLVQHGRPGGGGIDHPEMVQVAVDPAADGQVHQRGAGKATAEGGFGNPAELTALVLQGEQQELLDKGDRGGRFRDAGTGGAWADGHVWISQPSAGPSPLRPRHARR